MKVRVRLETLSPIHVGVGRDNLTGLDYILFNDYVYVIDLDRLIDLLRSRGLDQRYMGFVRGGSGRKLLSDFLRGVGLLNQQILESISLYKLRWSKGLQVDGRAIKRLIRGVDGGIYLPGSSIKGSLRTAIILHKLLTDEGLRERMIGLVRKISESRSKKLGSVVENVLRTERDFSRDVMRLLRPSDLFPKSDVAGEVARLLSLSFTSGGARLLGYSEVIPPGVVFEGFMEVLDRPEVVSYIGGSIGLQEILSAIQVRSGKLLDRLISRLERFSHVAEASKVKDGLGEIKDRLDGGDIVSTVGFGQGYWGVTVTEFKPELLHLLHVRGARGLRPHDFPRSLRVVDRGFGLEPLGWVLLRFEEVGE